MPTFEVNDMTCGHCVNAITKAVRSVDGEARVLVDLPTHRVQIETTESDASEFSHAIKGAGYTPVQLADAPALPEAAEPRIVSCCP